MEYQDIKHLLECGANPTSEQSDEILCFIENLIEENKKKDETLLRQRNNLAYLSGVVWDNVDISKLPNVNF